MSNELKYLDVAERVIRKHRRPMRAAEIVNFGIEDGFVESWESKTPQKSMQARLSIDILKGGKSSRFVRTDKGLFFLRGLLDKPLTLERVFLSTSLKEQERIGRYPAKPRITTVTRENVLVFRESHLRDSLQFQGIKKCGEDEILALLDPGRSEYIPRIEAEVIDEYKQIITYIMVTYGDRVLSFRRGSYSKAASFLRGSRCIGFGGHVTELDYSLFSRSDLGVRANAVRELSEELQLPARARRNFGQGDFRFRGLINDDSSDVGRRHLGVLLEYKVKNWAAWKNVARGETAVDELGWVNSISDNIDLNAYEYWSQLCWRTFYPHVLDGQPAYKIVRKRPFKRPHVICIVGTIGSGKSAATEFFKTWLRYREINSGQILARLLNVAPVPQTSRHRFQQLASNFIMSKDGPRRLAQEICSQLHKMKDHPVVIDGIRQRATLEHIRSQVDVNVAVIYVHAVPDVAYALYARRERDRGGMPLTSSEFFKLYSAPVEAEVRYLIQDADAVLYNWTGKSEYDEALDRLATALSLYPKAFP